MRHKLITAWLDAASAAATPADLERALAEAWAELTESEYTALQGKLSSAQNIDADLTPIGVKKGGEFKGIVVSGNDFESLEQCQRSTYATLPKLIVQAVLEGLEAGKFKIVDGRVVLADQEAGI